MTKQEALAAVDRATRLVESRPTWKRDILARSGLPTTNVPRPFVDNFAAPNQTDGDCETCRRMREAIKAIPIAAWPPPLPVMTRWRCVEPRPNHAED